MACPHCAQNFALRGFFVPHSAQKIVSGVVAAASAELLVLFVVAEAPASPSSSFDALRNSRTLFPIAPPTSGSRPAPNISRTMTRINPSSGRPSGPIPASNGISYLQQAIQPITVSPAVATTGLHDAPDTSSQVGGRRAEIDGAPVRSDR